MTNEIAENIVSKMIYRGICSTESAREARDTVAEVLSAYDIERRNTAIVPRDNTDNELVARFFVAKVTAGLSARSIAYYRYILSSALPKLGKRISDVTTDDIRALLTVRRMQGVSNSTLDNERRVMSSFFTFLNDEGLIESNPSKRVEKIRKRKITRLPFTEEDMENLRMAARTNRDRAIIEFLYSTGCRVSEMVALDVSDIDFQNREAVVLGKGNKERTVFLSHRCVATLRTYLNGRNDKDPALFVSGGDKHTTHLPIRRFTVHGVEDMVRNAGRRSGIANAHPHRIRRTAATFALRRGMPIEQVSKMLGHESLDTTTIYASSTTEEVKRSHDKYII